MSPQGHVLDLFWEGVARNELLLQRCTACGAFRHPPSYICQECLSAESEWVAASGRGTVYTYAIVRQALGRGWEEKIPYTVAVVELEEGPRFVTNLIDVASDDVTIGMPVELTFVKNEGDPALPKFAPRRA